MKQWTYMRNDTTSSRTRWFNCPCLVVYAHTIAEADRQFKAITGIPPSTLPHVGVRYQDVSHVGRQG